MIVHAKLPIVVVAGAAMFTMPARAVVRFDSWSRTRDRTRARFGVAAAAVRIAPPRGRVLLPLPPCVRRLSPSLSPATAAAMVLGTRPNLVALSRISIKLQL